MKYIHRTGWLLMVAIALLAIQFSCKKTEGYNTVVSTDNTKPGPVTNVKVVNFNGGAYITYTHPNSKNLLYVQAEYKINDKASRQTKSSYYSDSITVSGFAKSQDYKVVLYTVTRADVRSDSVVVTVHPDTPPYLLVRATIAMVPDFGGINISGINKAKANIGVVLISPDKTNTLQIVNQNYTNVDSISYSVRGYDTLPKLMGIYITDQWGNISDTIYKTITPIYEVQMDKSKFQPYVLPIDVATGFGWVIQNMWDGVTGGDAAGYHTVLPIQPLVWPAVITFDMGQTARLSRYTIWEQGIFTGTNYLWTNGAPLEWAIWGRTTTPVDEQLPDENHMPAVGDTSANGWIHLGTYNMPKKPSGLPNPQYTDADLAFWNAGFGFNFSLTLPKVRYLRFECLHNADLTDNYFKIMEMTFWGDAR
jgi:hypothetical protein